MIKTKSVSRNFIAKACGLMDEFTNEYLDKYEVTQIIKFPLVLNNISFINVTIIYKEEVFDNNDKELLKKIIKMEHISINYVQSELNIGFNRSASLISILEDNKIISNKEDGRKLLMDLDSANKLIDSLC